MTFSILMWVYPFDFVPHYMSSSPVVYQPRLTWNTGLYACVVGASQAVLCSPSLQPFLPPVCVFRVCVMCLRTTTESKGGNRPVSYCSPTLTWYDSAPSLCVLFNALLCPHTPNYTDSTLALHTHTHTLKLFEQPRPQSHRPRLASDPWQPPMYTPTCWPVVAGFLLVKYYSTG